MFQDMTSVPTARGELAVSNQTEEIIMLDEDGERERFERIVQRDLGISADQFAAKLDADDIDDLDRSAAMRVAILRPA